MLDANVRGGRGRPDADKSTAGRGRGSITVFLRASFIDNPLASLTRNYLQIILLDLQAVFLKAAAPFRLKFGGFFSIQRGRIFLSARNSRPGGGYKWIIKKGPTWSNQGDIIFQEGDRPPRRRTSGGDFQLQGGIPQPAPLARALLMMLRHDASGIGA